MAADAAVPMLREHVGCEFLYDAPPGVELIVIVEPHDDTGWARCLRSERDVMPRVPLREYRDSFGNRCWRITSPGGEFSFRYDAEYLLPELSDPFVPDAVQHPVSELPNEAILYTLPSRFCQSDLLMDDAWRLFGDTPEGWGRVQAICDWVHTNVQYGYGNSGPTTSAVDTFNTGQGVCRDFAQLPITFCRALNIPARYVFGYFPDYAVEPPDVPMDFHAWFEVYLGGAWRTFDARHNVPRIGRVKIAQGRDAVDVAMVTAYGSAQLLKMTVWSDAEPVDPAEFHASEQPAAPSAKAGRVMPGEGRD